MIRKVLFCAVAAVCATVVACNKSTSTPTSPGSAVQGEASAGADGSTLKVNAPGTTSPTGGGQASDPLTLVATTVSGKFTSVNSLSYRFQVRSGSTVASEGIIGPVSGGSVSFTPGGLQSETNYTWRVQATTQGQNGPWSGDASFKSPVGAFIRGNEVRDPLTIGRTVGEVRGPVEFTANGAKMLDHASHVLYRLPQTLQQGEFSMMILGADEGSEGDKSKVFAMQEGPDEGDITDDDYRMTAELRGRDYGAPGSVTYRIIAGDGVSRDGARSQINFNSSRWYFWKFSWQTGRATLEVRTDSDTGGVIYSSTIGTGSHPYRPDPHYLYLGTPMGRAGALDATLPGGIYKNVWASSRPRPNFP